jgi:hypothetical protein
MQKSGRQLLSGLAIVLIQDYPISKTQAHLAKECKDKMAHHVVNIET